MTTLRRAILLGTMSLCSQSMVVDAQREPRRLALVIGVSQYDALQPLASAVDDAFEIAKVLDDPAKFSVTKILDPSASSLRQRVRAFAQQVMPNDIVVVYYAGHGIQTGGKNYLLPSDFPNDASQLPKAALAADELLSMIAERSPSMKLLILDACRNSPLRGVQTNGLAIMEVKAFGQGTRLEFSAAAGQVAMDGMYARFLAAELAVPGQDVDAVFRNVRARVSEKTLGAQSTLSASTLTQNFYFVAGVQTTPGEALAQLDRVAARMPRGELGQANAVQTLVQAGQSLAGTDVLEGLSLANGRFSRASLSGAELSGSNFDNASLHNADLSRARLIFATLERATITDATLDSAAFAFVIADSARFAQSRARGSTWFAARAQGADFSSTNLSGAGFMFADLRGAKFDGATLAGASFIGSDLRGASFAGAVFDNTDFTGARVNTAALSTQQRQGACRRAILPVPPNTYGHVLSVTIIEPIPSDRFSGGFEYSRFLEEQYLFRLPANDFGICRSQRVPNNGWYPVISIAGHEDIRRDVSFRLSRKLLQQQGRRSDVRTRVANHLEWLYPFPAGSYTVTIAEADVKPEQRGLVGNWTLEFAPDGRLVLTKRGQRPAVGSYERQPRYAFTLTGGGESFGCAAGQAEYRWYLRGESLILAAYPGDPCESRAALMQARWWSRGGG